MTGVNRILPETGGDGSGVGGSWTGNISWAMGGRADVDGFGGGGGGVLDSISRGFGSGGACSGLPRAEKDCVMGKGDEWRCWNGGKGRRNWPFDGPEAGNSTPVPPS